MFGSFNDQGDQVDDGTYRMVDHDTFRIGGTLFDVRVDGDDLYLDPVISPCAPEECQDVQRAVSVA